MAANGNVPGQKDRVPGESPLGGFLLTGETFYKDWVAARTSAGLIVEPSVTDTLLPGGYIDRSILVAAVGSDTDEANLVTGLFSVPMLSTSTFAASDGPLPIYFHNNREFAKSSSGRSVAGLFLCLDPKRPTTHAIALISLEGAAIGKALATSAALSGTGNIPTDEWTDAAAVSTTALKALTLITTDPQTISSFSAGGVAAILAYPRNLTCTGGGTTAHCPTQVVWTGTDINDDALTETLALSGGSGVGVKAFKTLAAEVFTGATTGDGSCATGIGGKLGLTQPAKTRVGVVNVIREYAINAVATTGTYVIAATSPPNGTYAPSSAPDGTRDYALTYEQDVS